MSFITAFQNPDTGNISDDEYRLLRNLVYDECGIWLKDEKKSFLSARAQKRMKALNVASYFCYYKLLTDRKAGGKELITFLDVLTINETSFFRNRPQLDLFSDAVLPEIAGRKRKEGRLSLKIWSAGCSTGQEPYTIAMMLDEAVHDIRNWQITILASDLSLKALEAARKGFYPCDKMEGVEPRLVARHFRPAEGGYTVKDELRRQVVFDFHNLMHENGSKNFDIIFCRNVLIYFDEQTQKKVIDRFEKALAPNGYIFLGHAETLHGINDNFTFVHRNRGTAYRKKW